MNWTLVTTTDISDERVQALRYVVHDALGVRLGVVSGRIVDPDGRNHMLLVAVKEWHGRSEYLVPIGAVTLISHAKQLVQLRDVTKATIGRLCYRYKGQVPEPRLISSLQRHFPPPRPSVVALLNAARSKMRSGKQTWRRLTELDAVPPSFWETE